MENKTAGIPGYVDRIGHIHSVIFPTEKATGLFHTYSQLDAIVRAAFESARQWDNEKFNLYDLQTHKGYRYETPDDYLASPEYKTLTGRG